MIEIEIMLSALIGMISALCIVILIIAISLAIVTYINEGDNNDSTV